MLGRRRYTGPSNKLDLAERIRRRALRGRPLAIGTPANDTGRFIEPRATSAQRAERRPGRQSARRGETAKVLSFADTPVYRPGERQAVSSELVSQALELVADHMALQEEALPSRAAMAVPVTDLIDEVLGDLGQSLAEEARHALIDRLLDELVGLGPLELLVADDTVAEIMVNGPSAIYVARRGRVQLTDLVFTGERHLQRLARRLARQGGRQLDSAQPVVDTSLADGMQVCVALPPIALDGASMTLRKFPSGAVTLEGLARQGRLSPAMAAFLELAVRCRLNVLVTGRGGSGKTTLLAALTRALGRDERIVAIEDRAELQFAQPNVVRLQPRPAGDRGWRAVSRRDLLLSALKMRPDRLVLGALTGDEAADLLFALAGAHEGAQGGALATLLADSPEAALERLAGLMRLAVPDATAGSCRALVAHAIDLVVQVEAAGDGAQRVTRIVEVGGFEAERLALRDVFAFHPDAGPNSGGRGGGAFRTTGAAPRTRQRAQDLGLEWSFASLFAMEDA